MNHNKDKCVVVIPVHKPGPNAYELISFRQCFKVLGQHPIFIVAPQGMNIEIYNKVAPNLNVKWVDPVWMSSLLNYNKLKMSRFFYEMFAGYKYMLTYELDAFVFEDKLDYWCGRDYDYIGAPWFEGWENPGERLVGVGNSGFSIRCIDAIKKGIKEVYYVDPLRQQSEYKNRYLRYAMKQWRLLKNALSLENPMLQDALLLNEDWVIAELMGKKPDFKISPLGEAMHFSFEVKPEILFEMNGGNLPMGCHAWPRYNLSFWKPHIESFGYQL